MGLFIFSIGMSGLLMNKGIKVLVTRQSETKVDDAIVAIAWAISLITAAVSGLYLFL